MPARHTSPSDGLLPEKQILKERLLAMKRVSARHQVSGRILISKRAFCSKGNPAEETGFLRSVRISRAPQFQWAPMQASLQAFRLQAPAFEGSGRNLTCSPT